MNTLERLVQLEEERHRLLMQHNLPCVICIQFHLSPIQLHVWKGADNDTIHTPTEAVALKVEGGELTVLNPGTKYIPSEVFKLKEAVQTWMTQEIKE